MRFIPEDLTKGVKISTFVHLGLLILVIISPFIFHHKYKSFKPTSYTVQLVNLPGVKLQQVSTMPKPAAPITKVKEPKPIVQKKQEMVIPKKTVKKIIPREKTPNLAEKLSERFKEFEDKTTPAPKIAQADSGSLGSSAAVGLSTPSNFPFQWYLELIHGKISSCWTNPEMSLDKKYSAIISFTITKTGEIININVKRSSGVGNFDQSGIKAIELAKPFPQLPPGYAYPQLTVNVEFALE